MSWGELKDFDRQTKPTNMPFGWVQWKGTNVCLDIHCVCGTLSHLDADFAYYVRCPNCKRVYGVNGHVELVELTEEEKKHEPDSGFLDAT